MPNKGFTLIELVMVILIAFLPGYFAINTSLDMQMVKSSLATVQTVTAKIDTIPLSDRERENLVDLKKSANDLSVITAQNLTPATLNTDQKFAIRKAALTINKYSKKLFSKYLIIISNK